MPGEFTWWAGHAGGNQEILQKLWTLMTMVTIRSVLLLLKRDDRLTGAGDNKVAAVRFSRSQDLTASVSAIKAHLASAFHEIGLTV